MEMSIFTMIYQYSQSLRSCGTHFRFASMACHDRLGQDKPIINRIWLQILLKRTAKKNLLAICHLKINGITLREPDQRKNRMSNCLFGQFRHRITGTVPDKLSMAAHSNHDKETLLCRFQAVCKTPFADAHCGAIALA